VPIGEGGSKRVVWRGDAGATPATGGGRCNGDGDDEHEITRSGNDRHGPTCRNGMRLPDFSIKYEHLIPS
jgi:hypothetical protein